MYFLVGRRLCRADCESEYVENLTLGSNTNSADRAYLLELFA